MLLLSISEPAWRIGVKIRHVVFVPQHFWNDANRQCTYRGGLPGRDSVPEDIGTRIGRLPPYTGGNFGSLFAFRSARANSATKTLITQSS